MSARLTLPSGYKRPRVQPFSHHLLSSSVQPDHSLLTIERVKCHFRSSSPFEMRVKGVISFDEEIRDQFLSCSPVEECLDCPWCLSGPIIIRPSASFGPELKNNDFHLPNSLLLLLLMVLASIKKENRWPQVYWDYHKKKASSYLWFWRKNEENKRMCILQILSYIFWYPAHMHADCSE